jgi:hypothetical protein
MRVGMVPLGAFSTMMSELLTRCGKPYTSSFEWERSGRSDEEALDSEKKKTPEKVL